MKKTTIYKYLGTNGTIESPVHLEDIYYVPSYVLHADEGMILTNGEIEVENIRVSIDDLDKWKEIPKGQD